MNPMATSHPSNPQGVNTRSRQLASTSQTTSPLGLHGRRRPRSLSSSEDDQYAALYPHSVRRRRPPSPTPRPIYNYPGAEGSSLPRPDFKQDILMACRRGVIQTLDKLFYDASLVPARPDELPTTDEMVIEALDAPSTAMLSAVIRRDRNYQWSDLAIIKAIEKDKAFDPPLYLDAFLYLGLSAHAVWDKDVENHDALMWAIRSGSAEFVSMLLCAGADANGAKFRKVFSHIAVATGIWQIARRPQFAIAYHLIKHGAKPNGTGALQWAVGMLAFEKIKEGRVPWEANKIAQMLVEQGGAEINEIPPNLPEYPTLRHALGEAIFYENVDFVEYLLDHGADPSIRPEKDGMTAWEIAVSEDGLPSVIDALIGKGISPATLWGILRP